MTEREAREWIVRRWPDRVSLLDRLADLVRTENQRQNLVAASTLDAIWQRHLLDSAQLAALAPASAQPWVDVGTGGGFPGLVCAALRPEPVWLVEPRRRRAEFLEDAVRVLGLSEQVRVFACRVERIVGEAGVISARAVASIDALVSMCSRLISPTTMMLLPRGKIDDADVAAVRASWNMMFHVEPSLTSPGSQIAILQGLALR